MNLIKPENLKPSSVIAIVSVAGNIEDSAALKKAREYFENRGFGVKIFSPQNSCGYLSGDDMKRLECLHAAFADSSVDAVIAARGGYGSLRIVKNVDRALIKNNPKIFAGYSDITALLLMMWKKTGLMTFHAPMACSDFGAGVSSFTEQNFFETLKNGFSSASLERSFNGDSARGILWGGNLATVASLCGMDFLPDEGFVFFAEDVNEPVYKIDRMFTQLANIEQFRRNLKAIVLGDFSGLDDRELFERFIKELALSLNIPVFFGLKSGHERDKLTLPVGLPVSVSNLALKRL